LSSAFAVTMSFRMTAVMAILAGFPAARSSWYLTLSSGLNRAASKAGKRGGLLVIKRSEFGHGGDDLVGGKCTQTGDAGEDVVVRGELFVSGNKTCDFGIERFDVAGDLFEPLAALALERRDGEVLFAVLERGTIAHQVIACVHEFGQLVLLKPAGITPPEAGRATNSRVRPAVPPP
jgi:hypothetical protein